VREAMGGLKESKQALGAEVIAGLERFAPPTLLAQASRVNFSTRLFNLIVTNVPGPQFPLYLLGREMQELVPVAFLPENQALAVAVMSYNGNMEFGLLGDYDAMADLDVLAGFIRRAPRWVQALGLEWSWRLLMEPRKLWKRYLTTILKFIWLAGREIVGRGGPGASFEFGSQRVWPLFRDLAHGHAVLDGRRQVARELN